MAVAVASAAVWRPREPARGLARDALRRGHRAPPDPGPAGDEHARYRGRIGGRRADRRQPAAARAAARKQKTRPRQPLPSLSAGDWLQGPYVYALYQHYGFDRGAIGRLFIAGFGSSMVFGTFVGAAADRTGRKKAALTYVAAYSLGCFTKHSSSFSVLLVGRLLCGVATSLLYSAFESWLVAEHFRRGYDADLLGGTFAKAVFIGNGLVAIVGAGIIFYSETKRESFRERGREREREEEREQRGDFGGKKTHLF